MRILPAMLALGLILTAAPEAPAQIVNQDSESDLPLPDFGPEPESAGDAVPADLLTLPEIEKEPQDAAASYRPLQPPPPPPPPRLGLRVDEATEPLLAEYALIRNPGERLVFDLFVNPEAAGGNDAAPTGPPSAGPDEGPGRYVLRSERETAFESPGGTLLDFRPGRIEWRAPMLPGWHRLGFSISETRSLSHPMQGEQPGAGTAIEREVPVLLRYPRPADSSAVIEGHPLGLYPDPDAPDAPSIVQRMRENYRPPEAFLKVTPETWQLRISEHFRLGDFAAPHGADETRFIAVQQRLLDFLDALQEAVHDEFGPEARVLILRAFLSPHERELLARQRISYTEYNRYQYGDAVAFVVDADGDGRMDDWNRDGTIDEKDANVVADLVERVQRAEQVFGGLGVIARPVEPGWPDTPYVVVDTRGLKIRW